MKIVKVLDTIVPIRSDIANAFVDFSSMTASIVAVVTDVIRDGKPVVGYGFNSNGRYAQQGLLRERFIPRLEKVGHDILDDERENIDPFKAHAAMMANEKPGGHGDRSVAVGVLDMAIWDAVAKIEEKPLFRVIAERFNDAEPDPFVSVYAAGGYYYPGKGLDGLRDEMKSYLDRGYNEVKMKVGAVPTSEDMARIEAVLGVVGTGERLAVDVNGRFDLKQAIEFGHAIKGYNLRWYEEVGDPLDFALQAELANHYDGAMATGENLFSSLDAQNLLRYGGMRTGLDKLQFDPALSYGLVEYLRTTKIIRDMGFSLRDCIPHGGHQFALNIAAGLGLGGNESYPDVFYPFNGFADGVSVENGKVRLPEVPGIGIEEKAELMNHYTKLIA
ncbi:MAG: mandelate racemase/muconate lactonizing enzyme family protein [Alphaproteobacteria bacterium]